MTINSVVKAFTIMEALSGHDDMGVLELAAELEMDKSTVHRLLATMKDVGYLDQDPRDQRYSLSVKFLRLAKSHLGNQSLAVRAQPVLEELAQVTGEAANLAVLSGLDIVYVGHVASQHTIKANAELGGRYPAYCVAIGKAILAGLPPEKVLELYRDISFQAFTPQTVTTVNALQAELARVRQFGYAVDDEECSPGLFCVAAPINGWDGRTEAAVSVSFPKFRIPTAAGQKKITTLVLATAERLSSSLFRSEPAGSVSPRSGDTPSLTRRKKK